jgi:hypothetical protein
MLPGAISVSAKTTMDTMTIVKTIVTKRCRRNLPIGGLAQRMPQGQALHAAVRPREPAPAFSVQA